MKRSIFYPLMLAAITSVMFTACKKQDATTLTSSSTTSTTSSSSITSAVASTGSIAVNSISTTSTTSSSSGTTSTSTAQKDSIYMMNCVPGHGRRDTIAASALSSAITTYLTANYNGYTFVKAFKITDSLKTVTAYVVVIKYNSNIIGLKFNADGTFSKVLEQRAGQDLLLPMGFHAGGPFPNRDHMQHDTIALSAIPKAVKNFFTTTYPTDTLLHAEFTPDTTYILISKNKGLFATNISAAGKLIKRIQLNANMSKHTAVLEANLLPAITTYLTATYPGYVFSKAFAESVNNVVQEYDVFITSNNTKYVVKFSATGTFVKAVVLH